MNYIEKLKELAGQLSDYEQRMAAYYESCGIPVVICALQIGANRRETAEAQS